MTQTYQPIEVRGRVDLICEACGVTFTLRPLRADDIDSCAAILDALPDWFGQPDSNAGYIAGLRPSDAVVVVDGNHQVAGFVGLTTHNAASMEIEVMAVRTDVHRLGIGRRLVVAAVDYAQAAGVRWLHVKTRGPSTYDDHYEQTRRFYLSVGFDPLYESLTEWGPDDAALILVMRIDREALPDER